MDDDQVLRLLSEDLARDDPELAALLSDGVPRRRSRRAWLLLVVPVVCALVLLPLTVAIGVVSLLLVLASPLVAFCSRTLWDGGGRPLSW